MRLRVRNIARAWVLAASLGAGLLAVVSFAIGSGSVVATTGAASCVVPPTGLVSWWSGNGHANDLADGNDGAFINGATFANGHVGQAFIFDGTDDYIEVPDSPNLQITDTVTIDFWAKRQGFNSAEVVLEKGGDWNLRSETNYGVGLHEAGFDHMFYFFYQGGWRGTTGVSDLDWHHYPVVAVHGETNPLLYIDGVESPVNATGGSGTINLFPTDRFISVRRPGRGPTASAIY